MSKKVVLTLQDDLHARLAGQAALLGVPMPTYLQMNLANAALSFERVAAATGDMGNRVAEMLVDGSENGS